MTDSFYRAFQDRYRGSRELVKSRLQAYAPFVEPLTTIYGDCKAVDLGCGRGEWLEVAGDLGFDATGVDLDDGILSACRELGLKAEQGNAVDYLKGLRDESVVLVSGFHIAEHIPFPDLEVLVQEALRVLRPAGLLVLETPNPENIVVGTSGFYLDPTHTRPLPPRLLSFLTEHCGFERTRILRLQEPAGLATAAVASLMDVLGGVSPDYAAVAQKRAGTAEHSRLFDPAFSGDGGLELETLATRYDGTISGRLSEIMRRADRSAASEASADAAAKERVQAQLELAAREADLSATQRQLAATQRQLSATQQQLSVLLASPSWRLTGPLRSIAAAARDLRGVPARAVLKFKTWAKPGMIRFGGYISARPALKSGLLRAVKLFPWLHGRMSQAVRPGLAAATPGWDTGSAGARRVDDLAASARRVYQDLLDARNAEAGSRRVDLRPGERIDA